MDRIYSYPTVYNLGHKAILDIFRGPVLLEEKIDGSQFSFTKDEDGLVHFRSKGKQIEPTAPEKMFELGVEYITSIADKLHPGWIYRGEYLASPHHNTLSYARIPRNHIIGFDIQIGLENYLLYEPKKIEFERIGLETVPMLGVKLVQSAEEFLQYLDLESILGGCKIEGVVIKNYNLFTVDKKIAIGKYVSEAFKETNKTSWGKGNPVQGDILAQLITTYRTEARWAKAVQHLRDLGQLDDSPKDIGNIMKEVKADTLKESEDEIKDVLFKYFWSKLERAIIAGLPEWYKEQLLAKAFDN